MKCEAGRAGPGGPTTHRPPLGGSAAYVYAAIVIGLAIVGTVAWSAVASTRRSAAAAVLTDFNQPSAHHQVLNRSDSQPRRLKISDRATALSVSASSTPITNRHGCRLLGAMVESIQRLL